MMMDRPLLIAPIMEYAAAYHGDREIVSRTVEGPIHRYTYRDSYRRMQKLANALVALGVKPGDRIGTLAWNGYRHLELYYAVSGIGAVCHTINPRLFPDQLAYIINHAQDRFLFADLTFVPLVEALAPQLDSLEATVVMTDRAHMPETGLDKVHCYEELLDEQPESFEWTEFDDNTAAMLCCSLLPGRHRRELGQQPGQLPGRRADVPRLRLGGALQLSHGRRQAGVPGAGLRRGKPPRVDRGRRRHDDRRGADHLAGAARIPRTSAWSAEGRRRRWP
jgi:hypothetical protein